jgi:hypothetical protein
MNIQTMREFGESARAGDLGDERKMDQIRELIYGEAKREQEARIATLEMRVRELEVGLIRRLDALQARLDAMSGEITSERRTQFDELARSILDLGERVRRIPRE